MVRGLDYYNHTIFEFIIEIEGNDLTVCAGGRYDGLVAYFGGPETAGFGFGLGVERLLVETASQLLEGLSADIYTPSLRQLKEASQDLQAVTKSSGAGGGDCGIALSFDVQSTETLKNRWTNLGIELLYQERIGHDDKS